MGCDEGDGRARPFEQRRFAQRHFAAADDEDLLRAQIEEQREVLHGGYVDTGRSG